MLLQLTLIIKPHSVANVTKEGRVTLPQQPRFFAYGNNSINMTNTGYHTWATFTNTRFNVGNHFSTSTKLFTAPIAGTYLFGCNCRVDAGGVGYWRLYYQLMVVLLIMIKDTQLEMQTLAMLSTTLRK